MKQISLVLPVTQFGYYDAAGQLQIEPGWFDFFVGGSSAATLSVAYLNNYKLNQ